MTFLFPWALLGLLTLPVIVGMHLHLERNRRVVVSSMFLWSFLDEKFQGNTPKFIRISWLLLLDLLIAAFLSLAMAQPVLRLPALGGVPSHQIALVDTSSSMAAMDGEPDRFTMAQELVISMVEDRGRNDQVTVITIGENASVLGSTAELGQRELIRKIREISPLGIGIDLRSGLALAKQQAIAELESEIFVITDAAFELPEIDDFPLEIRWVFIGFEDQNQAVVDPQIGKLQGGQRELFFRLSNYSDAEVMRELRITTDGTRVFSRQVTLPPKAILPQLVDLSGDFQSVEIALAGTDLIPLDDVAFTGTTSEMEIDVAIVAENPFPIDKAISSIPFTRLSLFTPDEYIAELEFDLVIFRGMIPDRWPQATVLVFDPPLDNTVLPVLSPEPVDAITSVAPTFILNGVDLTGVRWESANRVDPQAEFEVLASAGNLPILLNLRTDESDIFLFTPSIDQGNFTKHPAFPIMLANLVTESRPFTAQPAYLVGDTLELEELNQSDDFSLTYPDGEQENTFSSQAVQLNKTGSYRASWQNKYGEQEVLSFGVNQGHIEESDIAPKDWRIDFIDLDDETEFPAQVIEVALAPWLLALVIGLLMLEAWRAWR